jgi:ATP/maltotriose-dependent transcriptional regulator MalT/two-component SAPR family response regulator
MDIIPEGIQAVFISRHVPPAAFARLRANNRIGFLGWNDIRFTIDETKELIKAKSLKLKTKGINIEQLHEKTDGWAAGLVLMTGAMESGATSSARQEIPYPNLLTLDTSAIFDYFAGELFQKTDREIQDFLLKTSFLPSITAGAAERLTGAGDAGAILSSLNRNHYFTNRLAGDEPVYQYHPLLREFLLNRVKMKFTPDELVVIQREAALLLEQSGQVEDAVQLSCGIKDCESITRIVISHARSLLMQGRNKTVAEWISCLPAKAIDNNPWLLYWAGMCSFLLDMPETIKYLEKAFESFKAANDTAGIYLSWAGIVDTYVFEFEKWEKLDDCIAMLNNIKKSYPSFPSKEIELFVSSRMLIALTFRKPNQPEMVKRWHERVSVLLQQNPSIDIRMDTLYVMSNYYLWQGEFSKNAVLLERMRAEPHFIKSSPFAEIRIKMMMTAHYWMIGQYDSALRAISEALALSDKSGVRVLDFFLWGCKAAAALAAGDMETAEKSLNCMTSLLSNARAIDLIYYHLISSWHALLKNNIPIAQEHLLQMANKGVLYHQGLWNIGMAHVAFLQGRTKDANEHLHTAHRISLNMKSHVLEWFCLLSHAYFLFKEGKEKEGIKLLRSGLSLGKRHGYVHIEFYQPKVSQFIYAKALEEGIEPDYVKELIRKQRLTPPVSLNPSSLLPLDKGRMGGVIFMEDWPYPIKIYTLGRFEITKDDMPLTPSRKAQKKPLEMLKALITMGSNGIPVKQITDLLWQEAEGDMAHKSFEITLFRLRRMLDNEKAVRLQDGMLFLDRSICWIDVWAFQNLLETILASPLPKGERVSVRGEKTNDILRLSEKAISMYKGHFLPAGTQYEWTLSLREQLRNRFHRLIIEAGSSEKQDNYERTVEYFQKGLAIDPLCEDFYQCLMVCYRQLGHKAEAVRTYNLCRTALSNALGITPSSKTEEIYSSLKRE